MHLLNAKASVHEKYYYSKAACEYEKLHNELVKIQRFTCLQTTKSNIKVKHSLVLALCSQWSYGCFFLHASLSGFLWYLS